MIRVKAIDTMEHITSFTPADDHVITLKKWQELNMPMSTTEAKTRYTTTTSHMAPENGSKSVFEDQSADQQRWRFNGPWLPSFTLGEFQDYLSKTIKHRRAEFREFVRNDMVSSRSATARRRAAESGQSPPTGAVTITDKDLDKYILGLRHDTHALNQLITAFLDLPTTPGQPESHFLTSMAPSYNGPPETHGSAGLSYLRSASFLTNHPLRGPQAVHPPIQARVLIPRIAASGHPQIAKLGVAGVVVADGVITSFKGTIPVSDGVTRTDTTTPGGGKAWVHPRHASIDGKGRIRLQVEHAGAQAIAVEEGRWEEVDTDPSKSGPRVTRESFRARGEERHAGAGGYGMERGAGAPWRDSKAVESEGQLDGEYTAIREMLNVLEKDRGGRRK